MLKFIKIAAALVLAAAGFGCGAAQPSPATISVTAQAMARGAVETAESVWLAAAQACVDESTLMPDHGAKCKAALLPARDGLLSAAGALDTWTDASQGLVACAVQDALGAVNAMSPVLGASPKTASLIADATALAHALGLCTRDGGVE